MTDTQNWERLLAESREGIITDPDRRRAWLLMDPDYGAQWGKRHADPAALQGWLNTQQLALELTWEALP